MEMLGEVVDAHIAGRGQALEDAQAGRVGEGQEVVGQLVPRALEKHKGSFIQYNA